MQKQTDDIMKSKHIWTSILLLIITTTACSNDREDLDYLRNVATRLSEIQNASYLMKTEGWQPGDKKPTAVGANWIYEFDNPSDTTIGAKYIIFNDKDSTLIETVYDGEARMIFYHDKKGFIIDNFTFRSLPFRPITVPFFNLCRNIIEYTLNATDSITTEIEESDSIYYLKLTILKARQVEFFGKAHEIPDHTYSLMDPTSIYELWIDKSTNLPYKLVREMSHNISVTTCSEVKLNHLSEKIENLYNYMPHGYEYRRYGVKNTTESPSNLLKTISPNWSLTSSEGQPVSLSEIKSKVVLLNFTGIGCGPCMLAIPYLNELKERYSRDDLDIVAIETWNRQTESLKNYSVSNKIDYTLVAATDEVCKAYQLDGAVPLFIILDKDRTVHTVLKGFSIEKTGKEISAAIDSLLSR